MSRISLAVKSSGVGLLSQVLLIIINFVIRTCFINYLGIQIMGIDGVIKDFISFLSLAELGISSAMIYRLYKAVITNNENEINELLVIYKQIYRIIAISILIIGLVLSIFLKIIITDVKLPWIVIYTSYYLQLIATIITYLLAYKRSILNADQKNYIIILIDTCTNISFSILKVLLIIFTHNYIVYLIVSIIGNATSNIVINNYSNKIYPFLSNKCKINKSMRNELLQDTKNVFAGKLAGYIYNSTDNLIISIFKSTVIVGYLSNYKFVFLAVRSILNCIATPIQLLIGNYLNLINNKEQTYRTFKCYTQIRYLFSALFLIPTICLCNSFITIWAGSDYVLNYNIVFLMAIDLYIGCIYGPLGEYIIGLGMFKYEKYATISGAVINLVASTVGILFLGIQGVLLGTVISQFVLWFSKGYIVFIYYFNNKKMFYKYWMDQFLYIFVFILMILVNMFSISFIKVGSELTNFIIEGIIIEVVSLVIYIFIYRKSTEYLYFKSLLSSFLNKRNLRRITIYKKG
jgi:O-antigen/teichoic acid export membrane protein